LKGILIAIINIIGKLRRARPSWQLLTTSACLWLRMRWKWCAVL